MKIDHICFAVIDLQEGITYWESVFGYKQMTNIVKNSLQQVKVVFLTKKGSVTVKLIEPYDENESLKNFINRGGNFHHICFKCADLNEKINELTQKGLITLVPPQQGEVFDNNNIAFLLAKYGLNIELIDTDKKAGLL